MTLTGIYSVLCGTFLISFNAIPFGLSRELGFDSEDDTTSGHDTPASVLGDTTAAASATATVDRNTSLQQVDGDKTHTTIGGAHAIWDTKVDNILEGEDKNNTTETQQANTSESYTAASVFTESASGSVVSEAHNTQYMTTTEHPKSVSGNWYEFDNKATNRFLASDATKFICGTENLCNTTMEPENGHCSVECDPCQCDDMCHFYGDCCPDLLFRDSPDTPSTPSPYVACLDEHWTTWGNLTDMWVVSRCPDHPGSSTVAKCEQPDNDNPDQATPVSNVRSQVTYRNTFCAQCHGDENVEPWTHQVECRTNTALNTAKSKADLWRLVYADEWCEVESSPPEGVIPRLCFHAEVNSCRDDADPVMKNLCASFQYTVDYYGSSPSHTKYRNIFCALCNGEVLDKDMECNRLLSPDVPYPLNALLNFNPMLGETDTFGEDVLACGTGKIFDPFSGTCRIVSCSKDRTWTDGACTKTKVSEDEFTVYQLQARLTPTNSSYRITKTELFIDDYYRRIKKELKRFDPIHIPSFEITVYTKERYMDMFEDALGDLAAVDGQIMVLNRNINATDVENALVKIFSRDFSYNESGVNASFNSRFHRCEKPFQYSASYQPISSHFRFTRLAEDFPECETINCMANVSLKQVQLSCPFVEYVDRFEENFTFHPVSYHLEFVNHSFFIAPNDFQCCERVLRICVETIANITKVVFGDKSEPKVTGLEQDLVLSIVSLVCISLSLGSLALTFLVYSVVPKLRTLPGKNSMALMFHLFWAQLFFLTTSNRTANAVMCQVFAIMIHYFWMASFTWMLISAYHMYTVFTRIIAYTGDGRRDSKRLVIYSVTGIMVPLIVIVSCVAAHSAQHQGIGYGASVCFLNNPTAIGVFFVAPLILMLLLNGLFFTKTILAIRSVPDMKEASNKSRKHHVFVYIKLSLLFGFTWIFGIVGAIFQSKILEYVFVILTGGQGVMIFVAYSLNQRTWELLKDSISGGQKSASSDYTNQSGNRYTVSMDMTSGSP